MNRFEKVTALLDLQRLQKSCITVFGIGGVGSVAAETLVRSGLGKIILVDYDKVELSNINRQIPALESTVGKYKTEILQERFLDINPELQIEVYSQRATKDNFSKFAKTSDFVVDAIDSLTDKAELIEYLYKTCIPFISSMGTANRKNPTKFVINDISKTYNDPLAKRLRKELRKREIEKGFDVVFSQEPPIKSGFLSSLMYVTAYAGLLCAWYAVTKLTDKE